MHKKDIFHRDLKPENVLIADNGYIRIADFGFVKQVDNRWPRTTTFCGTPEYIAPEVILSGRGSSIGYGRSVDCYALGIIMYELIQGYSPFRYKIIDGVKTEEENSPEEILNAIVYGKIRFVNTFDKEAKSLVKKLTHKEVVKRWGSSKSGI